MIGKLPMRGTDKYGSGEFGASRGEREHKGIDLACYPDTEILSPVSGVVSKLGYPYKDDLNFMYVQITVSGGTFHRVFYIIPAVSLGDVVDNMTVIGLSQDLTQRYPGITNHVHYEIKTGTKEYLLPG